jgi:hypothetical protein
MGYRIEEQRPWGAVALIAAAGTRKERTGAPADSVLSHAAPGGTFDGASDPRRPAGAALAP